MSRPAATQRGKRTRGNKVLTDNDLLQDMRIAAQACPRGLLSKDRYEEIGRYDAKTPVARFGSWKEALRRALPEVYAQRHPTPEQMITDLRRVAQVCQKKMDAEAARGASWLETSMRTLSIEFYTAHGKFTGSYVRDHLGGRHFGTKSWPAILTKAGIDVQPRANKAPTTEEMILDVHRVSRIFDRTIHAAAKAQVNWSDVKVRRYSKEFYGQHGKYHYMYVYRHLCKHLGVASWTQVKLALGLVEEVYSATRNKQRLLTKAVIDDMPGPRVPGQKNLRDEDIIQDMRIAAASCPRGELSVERYNKYGRYHSKNAIYRFGSWNEAMRRALPEVFARRNPTVEQMIDDLKRVAELCRRQIENQNLGYRHAIRRLSKDYYDKHGKYAHTYLLIHLGPTVQATNWTELKVAIGITDV